MIKLFFILLFLICLLYILKSKIIEHYNDGDDKNRSSAPPMPVILALLSLRDVSIK